MHGLSVHGEGEDDTCINSHSSQCIAQLKHGSSSSIIHGCLLLETSSISASTYSAPRFFHSGPFQSKGIFILDGCLHLSCLSSVTCPGASSSLLNTGNDIHYKKLIMASGEFFSDIFIFPRL